MFCPACGGEYREGFTRCDDCDVDLVETLPSAPVEHVEPGGLETIFGTGDPVVLLTAKSLLEEAGIPCITRGEGLQDLFGMGRLGTGFSLVAGPMEILVPGERRQEAAELLHEARLEGPAAGSDEGAASGEQEGSSEEGSGEQEGSGEAASADEEGSGDEEWGER
ncbi:MAG TPA: DUF2007 domain-containing protein [Thermoanaerobaculia bacterium]|jgi:hypothetical protein|nr:DUF2007 domain-containing protein [Thermoanaerobaculia bacterium]